jgi:hypothetical protein
MKRNKKNKRDPTATVSAGVALLETAEIEHVSMIANGLSALLVRVLVAGEGASPDLKSIMSLLSYTDRRGRTPLHRAAAVGNTIAAMTMISTIVSSIKSKSGSTSSISQANILQEWISKKDITGHTSAEIACIYGHSSFAMLLTKGSGSGEGGMNESDVCNTVLATILSSKSIDDTTTVTSTSFIETKSADDGGWRGSGIGITAAAGLRSVARNLRTRNNGIVPHTTEEDDDSKFDFFSKFDHDCDLEIVSGVGLSPESFFKRFYSINKPVVLRALGLDWPQRKLWKREILLSSNASKSVFLPSQIPYGRAFGDSVGDSEKSGKATLRDYILSLDAKNGEAFGAPLYIFDSPIAASRGAAFDMSNEASQALIDDLEMVPPFLRYDIPGIKLDSDARTSASIHTDGTSAEETNHTTRTSSSSSSLNAGLVLLRPAPSPQFYLGGPGTGSPFHFHKDAFNALMYGKKRWFLIPPASALYSTVPISTWVVNTSLDGPKAPKGLQMCTQNAGDVLYIPHGWAHGVVNLETSVGVAVEFSSILQE